MRADVQAMRLADCLKKEFAGLITIYQSTKGILLHMIFPGTIHIWGGKIPVKVQQDPDKK